MFVARSNFFQNKKKCINLIVSVDLANCQHDFLHISVGDRLSVSLTGLLTAVAFKFIIHESLPPVAYNTFLDAYLLGAFVFMSLTATYNGFVGKWTEPDDLEKTDRVTLGIFFGSLIAFTLWWFVSLRVKLAMTLKSVGPALKKEDGITFFRFSKNEYYSS